METPKAAFKLISYSFDKVTIDNANFQDDELLITFNPSGRFENEKSQYDLKFLITTYNEDKKDNPYLSIECNAVFKFENVSSFEEIPPFFYVNSIAILFPYVRAYVSLITTQAQVKGIILPTYNLSHLGDELKENSINK